MSHFLVLEVKSASVVKTPCEAVRQVLRHCDEEQGSRPLFRTLSAESSLDLDAVPSRKDWWAIPLTKAVTGRRCHPEGRAGEDMNPLWTARWLGASQIK